MLHCLETEADCAATKMNLWPTRGWSAVETCWSTAPCTAGGRLKKFGTLDAALSNANGCSAAWVNVRLLIPSIGVGPKTLDFR
jgi:hypothetical protein